VNDDVLTEPLPVDEIARLAKLVLERVGTVVVGMSDAIELALASVLAGGHVLFEDVPGLGKTLAARSLAASLGLDFRRLTSRARSSTPRRRPSSCSAPARCSPGCSWLMRSTAPPRRRSLRCLRRWPRGR
jgi:transposase